jgi:DNA primase
MMLNLDPLLDAIDLVHLAEKAGTTLKRQGRAYSGICPLHADSDNSSAFSIFVGRDQRQKWHCFTRCDDGGDAVSFIQRWKGLDFIEAVKWLSEYTKIPLADLGWSPEAVQEHKRRIQVYDLLTRAAKFYERQLWNAEVPQAVAALEYARGRGFADDHLVIAGWGFSASDNALLNAMLASDDNTELLPMARKIGLIRADGCDFTANANGDEISPDGWLIYPHFKGNKVVYLSSRALSPVEKGSKSRNLPITPDLPRQIYRAEWGLDGRPLANDDLVIVEGPADAETVRGWGWPAWALTGWAIGDDEDDPLVVELRRRAERDTIFVALSNDQVGRQGAERVAEVIGPLAHLVWWPLADGAQKSDANDWLQRGASEADAQALFDESPVYLDTIIDEVAETGDVKRRAEGLEHLADLVARLGEVERNIYLRSICDNRRLGIGRREFEAMVAERMPRKPKPSGIEIMDGEFCLYSEPLCNFTARVSHELMMDNGQGTEIRYTLTGKLANGPQLPPLEIPAEEFDKMRWIGSLWGARPIVYVGSSKLHHLRRAILEQSAEKMTRERVHTCTGWYDAEDKRVFLSSSGALSLAGLDESARVVLDNNLAHYHLPIPPAGGDLNTAIRASLAFLEIAPLSITVPLWAAMFAAPLTEIKSLNAVIWIYGPTQSKKSSIAHLALTHFGAGFVQGRDYKSPLDWTSTAADIEGTLFTCKDIPLIIDDYAPQFTTATESRMMAKKAHYVVRSVGNRSSRGRRWADMTARQKLIPRGLAITTAEQPLSGQSIVGRTITVPVEIDSINTNRLSEAQAIHHLYSQTMAAYIVWVADQWNKLTQELPREFSELQAEVQDRFSGQDRLADYFAILGVGSRLALRWMNHIGAIDDVEMRIVQHEDALFDLLEGQSSRITQQSPVLKFFQAIEDLLAQGKVVLPSRSELGYSIPFGAELIGWRVHEKEQIYLLTAPALIQAKHYWNDLDERFDTLTDALRREMSQYGYLAKRDPRQFETNEWINTDHGSRRVLVINASQVETRLGIDLLDSDNTPPEGEND